MPSSPFKRNNSLSNMATSNASKAAIAEEAIVKSIITSTGKQVESDFFLSVSLLYNCLLPGSGPSSLSFKRHKSSSDTLTSDTSKAINTEAMMGFNVEALNLCLATLFSMDTIGPLYVRIVLFYFSRHLYFYCIVACLRVTKS